MAAPPAAAAATEAAVGGAMKVCCAGLKQIAACGKACCNTFGSCVKTLPVNTVSVLLRVLNLANACLLGAASYFAFGILGGNITRTFLATYIGLFGLLLMLFETRFKYTENFIRRNFGFLFTYSGRTVFLIFLGAVCFGMLGDDVKDTDGYTWCLTVGLATLANSIFNCFIICNHPGFQAANQPHAAPAGGDPAKMSDEQIRAYLAAHPELTAKVAASSPGAESVAVPVAVAVDQVPDWAKGRDKGEGGAGGSGASKGGIGGMFGFGRKKEAQAPAAEAYVPPSIPAAPTSGSAGNSPSKGELTSVSLGDFTGRSEAAAPAPAPAATISPRSAVAPPPVPARAAHAPLAPAPAAPAAAFAIAEEEDNPFASDNPFGQ